jgi:hypothetical protein
MLAYQKERLSFVGEPLYYYSGILYSEQSAITLFIRALASASHM